MTSRVELSWPNVLDFEAAATTLQLSVSVKARWIREDFDISLTRYHQALVKALELPEALEYAPALVARLRRLRDERRAARQVPRPDSLATRRRAPRQPVLQGIR